MFNKEQLRELILNAKGSRDIKEYAKDTDVDRSYISRMLNLKLDNPPSPTVLKSLSSASYNNISYKDLMICCGYMEEDASSLIPENTCLTPINNCEIVKVPILGVVRAGMPMYASENITGYETMTSEEYKSDMFYLQVTGDSMKDEHIINGSKILIKKQDIVENGEIAVVLVNGDDATVKKVKFIDDKIYLFPANPNYDILIYDRDEVKIIGKVIRILIDR